MSETVTAIYEDGILRPIRPLSLKERQTVRIHIEVDSPKDEQEKVTQLLMLAGLIIGSNHDQPQPPDPVSAEERRKIAKALGKSPGKSLSEIVIEDRESR